MLTPYRQKYNPKKPRSKIRRFATTVQVFFKKNFSNRGKAQKQGKWRSLQENSVQKKVPPHSLMEKDVIKTRFILNLVSSITKGDVLATQEYNARFVFPEVQGKMRKRAKSGRKY